MATKLGWRQRHMLDFITRNGADRRYSIHSDENRTARSLAVRGLLIVIDCGMCTSTGRTCLMVTGPRQ